MDVGAFAAVGVGVFMVVWVGLGWCLVIGRKGEGKGRNGEDIGGEGRCGYECVGDGWLRGAVD